MSTCDPASPLQQPYRPVSLPRRLAEIAAEADRALLDQAARPGASRYGLYALLRQSIARAVAVDSFYVGLCGEGRTVVFPYNYDGAEFDDPNVNTWRPGGLTEWIVTFRRPYWLALDDGDLLHRGRPFGDASRRSQDAVAVPLLAPMGQGTPRRRRRVIGVVSMLSYTPEVYGPAEGRLLECLAESLSVALARADEDRERRRRFGTAPSVEPGLLDGSESDPAAGVARYLSERLRAIRRRAVDAAALTDGTPDPSALRAALDDLCHECEQAQTEAFELLVGSLPPSVAPQHQDILAVLTPREREVALLLATGLTNRQIGERLFVSEKTAKTHCQNVLRKLGVRGRSAIALLVRPPHSKEPPPTL